MAGATPEAVQSIPQPEAAASHSNRRRARELPFRDIGRKVVLFASVNAMVALFLPWVQTSFGSASAFGLGALSPEVIEAASIAWVATAVWFVPLGAVIAATVALVDRRRSTGMLLPYVSLAAGGWMVLLAGNVFETCPALRQLGVVACGTGGLIFICGGAILLKARWKPSRTRAVSVSSTLRRLPWASIALVVSCVAVHAVLSLDNARAQAATLEFGLIAGSPKWYALATYIFLHGDWLHLATNAAVLLAVGSVLERRVGRMVFVAVFIITGMAGGVLSAALDPRIHAPLVGSSGGVAGCVGLCLIVAPRARVAVWVHVGVAAAKLKLQAAWLFSAWMLHQAVGSFYLSAGESDSVACWAHLGGMVAGIAFGAALRWLGRVRPADVSADKSSREGESANSRQRRLRRRERSGLRYMPHALVTVAVLVSALAAALTFRPASLERSFATFQRAWNSGDLDRLTRFFGEDSRRSFRTRLGALVGRFDPDAPEGHTRWRIALASARHEGDEITAAFVLSPPREDPFRVRSAAVDAKRLSVLFRREGGAWVVRAIAANVRPVPPAELDAPTSHPW